MMLMLLIPNSRRFLSLMASQGQTSCDVMYDCCNLLLLRDIHVDVHAQHFIILVTSVLTVTSNDTLAEHLRD